MKKRRPTIKTLDRLKAANLADRLIRDIQRVLPPDTALFHEAIMRAGPPETTQSLRYLPFNRQVHRTDDAIIHLSLVALFNNPCMDRFILSGFRKWLSRLVYRFRANEMDRFIRALRLDRRLLHIMATAGGGFSILGILQRDDTQRGRLFNRHRRIVRPLLLVPTTDTSTREYILEFERRQTIATVKMPLLPFYLQDRSSPDK
jgi:hypothetical protein